MLSAICFDLDQSKILSSGNGLNLGSEAVLSRINIDIDKFPLGITRKTAIDISSLAHRKRVLATIF